MARALVIAPQPFFSPRGTPLSVYYRTLVTAELGVEVDLLTYGQGEDVDIPGVRIIRIPRFPFIRQVRVGPSGAKLVLDVFIFLWTIALLVRRRYDFVHAHEEAVFFCRYLKPILGFKLVYDMHSSLPQQLTNFKFTESRLPIWCFEFLENSCLAKADAVITICPALADHALARMPDETRHFLIENSIFEAVRLKSRSNDGGPRNLEKLPEARPIVGYAGTFEAYQGLDILIRAFARVRERKPDAFLLLVGGSFSQVDRYRGLALECGLAEHTLFTGRVEHALVKRYLEGAAVLVSPRKEGTNTPLKIYEQLASGIPLVATRIYSHTQVLSDDVCFLVEPEPESMADGVLEALENEEQRQEVVARAKALYQEKYSRGAYEEKMRRLLEALA